MNLGYLKKFILNPGQPSKARVQRDVSETSRLEGQATRALVYCREVNAIFGASPIEGTTTKERAIYVNMGCRMVLTGPPSIPSRPITISNVDDHTILFPHNNTLVITMHIRNYRVFKILIDAGSIINILYGGALYRLDDNSRMAQAMISPQN